MATELPISSELAGLADHDGPEIEVWLRARGPLEASLLDAIDETERLVVSDLSRGRRLAQRLVAVADSAGVDAARVRSRRVYAQAQAYSSRFDDALQTLRDATTLADGAGLTVEGARARLASMHSLAYLGRLAEAVAAGEEARGAFMLAGERVLAARADINLGVTLRMMDDPRGAIARFDRANLELDDQPMLRAQLESNRAEAMLDQGRFGEAKAAFENARALLEQLGAGHAASLVSGNLADLAGRQGRFREAIEHFERARRALPLGEAPGDDARLCAEEADALASLGMPTDASEAFRAALPVLDAHGMVQEAARARLGLARVLLRLGEGRGASEALELSGEAFRTLGNATGQARVRLAQAQAALKRGDPGEAEESAIEAAALMTERPADLAAARLVLARAARAAGRVSRAEHELREGLVQSRELGLAPLSADLLHERAQLHRTQGRLSEAAADLREAVAETERVRGALQAERFRAAYASERARIGEDCVSAILDAAGSAPGQDAIDEAFAYAERARSRSLLDLAEAGSVLVHGVPGSESPQEVQLVEELGRRRDELNELYSRLDDGRGRSDPTWTASVHQCERRLVEIERRLSATNRFARAAAPTATAAQVRAGLSVGTTLVSYFEEQGRLSAFILRPDGAHVARSMARLHDVERAIDAFLFQVDRGVARGLDAGARTRRLADDANAELRVLHAMIMGPLEGRVGSSGRLIVCPTGALHAVPFHALHDGRCALVESRDVSVAPSASLLLRLAAPGAIRPGRVVVGVPDERAPHAGREATEVAALLGPEVTLLCGAEATRERLAQAAAGAGLIHIASHARFMAGDPLSSGMRLSDGWLTARDVYRMDLRGSRVVLSGCDTGRAAVSAGDESVGLLRSMVGAGVKGLIFSLWPAHDRTTAELMSRIYSGFDISQGNRLVHSLCEAQRQVMASCPHPAAWASFSAMEGS